LRERLKLLRLEKSVLFAELRWDGTDVTAMTLSHWREHSE